MNPQSNQTIRLPGIPGPIPVSSIICAEGYSNYTWLYTIDQHKHLVSMTLKRVELHLPSFIRVHKSSLINPHYLAQVSFDSSRGMRICLTDGTTRLVARRRIGQVRHQLEKLV